MRRERLKTIDLTQERIEQRTKQERIQAWQRATEDALEAMYQWRAYLQVWQWYNRPIDDDFFMAVVQEMSRAGLLEWMDGNEADLDKLREVLTGVNSEHS